MNWTLWLDDKLGARRAWLALAVAASLGGCSTLAGFWPTGEAPPPQTQDEHGRPLAGTSDLPLKPSEQLKVLPVGAADLVCPDVDIFTGGAALRVGGPSNETVRYQFRIDDFARECEPAGDHAVSIKVGAKGRLLLGPMGTPGALSADLRLVIRHETDQKIVVNKAYKVTATPGPNGDAPFELVMDPVELPVISTNVASEYSIFIGFGNGALGDKPGKTARAP